VSDSYQCSKNMVKTVGFGRFVVQITQQRQQSGKISTPKTKGSRAWVACFNKDAAALIIALTKNRDPQELLFNKYMSIWYGKLWAKYGIKDVTLKDLRRASILWLGQSAGMEPLHLMKHARHSSIETTMLYCRQPEEKAEDWVALDLDA